MLAVGIDISKSKSVAAILNQDGSMHTSPFEFHHTQPEPNAFIKYILNSNQLPVGTMRSGIVTGPSLTRCTCMSAPKRPVATCG